MKILALDISTRTGYAVLEGEPGQIPKILETGTIELSQPVSGFLKMKYPWDYINATDVLGGLILGKVSDFYNKYKEIDFIVIEETNKAARFTSRYSQKILEWIHNSFLNMLIDWEAHNLQYTVNVKYINTSDWRKVIGVNLTKADKAMNAKVRKLKKAGDKEALKKLGVRGKIGKKHVAVRYVNATFGTTYKLKDNDICDAICQGVAYFLGIKTCDGIR